MDPESKKSDWHTEDWQVSLESRIQIARPIASPTERERILFEAGYQRGRLSMRVPSFLIAIGSCAATVLVSWCSAAFMDSRIQNEEKIAELQPPSIIEDATLTEKSDTPSFHAKSPSLSSAAKLSVVSIGRFSSSEQIEKRLRELDRAEEQSVELTTITEPILRARSNPAFF